MKPYLTVGLFMLASATLGALAIQTLHAQAKSPAYVIVEFSIKDQDAYTKEYVPLIRKSIQGFGGIFMARSGKTISFQGDPPAPRVVVLRFESLDKAQAWADSKEYKDAKNIGNKVATFRSYAVEGVLP